jgi:hypothetical protein
MAWPELLSVCPECLGELGDAQRSVVGRDRNCDFDGQILIGIRNDQIDLFRQLLGSVDFNVNYRP